MAFDFEALKKKAADLVESGKDKARELSEISKLKVQNANERDALRKAYLEIGKRYCEEHAEDPGEGYAELCRQVAESKAKIAYNNERIQDIKAAGDIADDDVEPDNDEL